ncbi:MAG: hypothetical protein A3G20_10095 [Acidobacteria bacterium RIFCSPLOWO2_12_FULL_59_11]|nr:MAG: hypothetical protein A3G20_10095 [Acidobacteria bacterium RIFCSPLOWO2_12_FULL_59_11]
MANPSDRSITTEGTQSLSAFRGLYDNWVGLVVNWSEREILIPQYFHLHEGYLGLEKQRYRLGNYVNSFAHSLGDLLYAFKRIVFCYSYEAADMSHPTSRPEACTRERFYWYELKVSEGRQPALADFTCPHGTIEAKWQIPPLLNELPRVLSECELVQPYMLRQDQDVVHAIYSLQSGSPKAVEALIKLHCAPGSYQFSIYGFEMADGRSLTEAESLLINMAFLVHIWTWNHDLRTAHLLRHVVMERLPAGQRLWQNLQANLQSFLDLLSDLHSTEKDDLVPIFQVSTQFLEQLFGDPHDLSNWTPDSFPAFVNQGQSSSAIREYLIHCGVTSNVDGLQSNPVFLTRARGAWLSTKYLTRCALDPEGNDSYRKLSFDQVLLAALVGLNRGRANCLPVRVMRTVDLLGDTRDPQNEKDILIGDALRKAYLAYENTEYNWLNQQLLVDVAAIDNGNRVDIAWHYDGSGMQSLPAFLSSGMLAMQMVHPFLHVFGLPKREPTARVLLPAHFLFAVSEIARVIGTQLQYPQNGAEGELVARPEQLVATHTIVCSKGAKKHGAELRFEYDRVLPDQAARGGGELGKRIFRFVEFFGGGATGRATNGAADAWSCNVSPQDARSDVVLTFPEGLS